MFYIKLWGELCSYVAAEAMDWFGLRDWPPPHRDFYTWKSGLLHPIPKFQETFKNPLSVITTVALVYFQLMLK